MTAAVQLPAASPPHDRLSWRQICALYPDQWVLLVDVEWTDDTCSSFRTALVGAVGINREDTLEASHRLRPRYWQQTNLFTGRPRPLRPVAGPREP